MSIAFEIVRLCAVVALVCVAGALATPKGRLPLALRGLAKLVNAVPSAPRGEGVSGTVSCGRRLLAFLLVLLAIILSAL